jgi:hypothetical protein
MQSLQLLHEFNVYSNNKNNNNDITNKLRQMVQKTIGISLLGPFDIVSLMLKKKVLFWAANKIN